MKSITLLVVLTLTGITSGVVAGEPATAPATLPAMRIVLVGDSTVTDNAGWGAGFKAMLKPDVECINTARGGRSSKSFRDEGHWDKAVAIRCDYMLIQFGHNDQPGKGPERETDPATTFPQNMKRYVEEARAAGIKPILVTSLTRRAFGSDGKIKPDLTAYADATAKVAAELGVPLIDLQALSIEFCNSIGPEGCERISPPPKDGKPDRTHLNSEGSAAIGRIVASELVRVVPEFTGHVSAAPQQ